MDEFAPRRPASDRRTVALALVFALVVAAIGASALLGGWFETEDAVAEPTTTTVPPSTTTTIPYEVPPITWVATPVDGRDVPAYDAPDGAEMGRFGHWYGYLQTSPILERQGDWVLIRMPERPNGTTAWVRASDVEMTTTSYRIIVSQSETKVTVYKDGFTSFAIEAVLGKASTPTPLGSYYLAVIEQPGPHGYGPVVLNTQAHSEAIQSWQGAGDAIIAFHGPFGAQETIRSGGGYLSNGCIRLLNEDQLKLDGIPLGTPIDFVP